MGVGNKKGVGSPSKKGVQFTHRPPPHWNIGGVIMGSFKSSFSWDDSKLKKLQQRAEALSREGPVGLTDLMPDAFIQQHSNFQSLTAIIDASGIESIEDIGNELFSQFIANHTTFVSWEEMKEIATGKYINRKLGG